MNLIRSRWYKKIKRKINSSSKVIPNIILFPLLLLIGSTVLYSLFSFLTKGLMIVGLLILLKKYLKDEGRGGRITKKKTKSRAKIFKKTQQKQPSRNIIDYIK